jgi:hypothetical protein
MRVVFTDVSVFFDLHTLQILPEFFGLNWHIQTTDFVFNEILQANQVRDFDPFVRSKKLNIISISVEEEVAIRAKVLREEARHQKIEVHGSIWVIDQLVKSDLINKQKAIALLNKLVTINSRLPMEEIKKQIEQYKE